MKYDISMMKVGKEPGRIFDYPLAFLRNLKVDSDEENDEGGPDLFADALILITNGAS